MKTLLTALTFVLGCLDPTPAWTFYCGNRLVSWGEPQTTVWYKCGAPDLRSAELACALSRTERVPLLWPWGTPFWLWDTPLWGHDAQRGACFG